MNSHEAHNGILNWMDSSHQRLFSKILPPKPTKINGNQVYRFEQANIEEAIILKLARIVSGLRSALVLVEHGLLQEQAAICRMVDEYQEDVTFLSLARIQNDVTELHTQYLEANFKEETHPSQPKNEWHKGRALVSRKKIHAYISFSDQNNSNPSDHNAVQALLKNVYSGFVHAAAVQVLEMHNPIDGCFMTGNQQTSPLYASYKVDLNNYFIRGCYAFRIAAAALEDQEMSMEALTRGDSFDQETKHPGHF